MMPASGLLPPWRMLVAVRAMAPVAAGPGEEPLVVGPGEELAVAGLAEGSARACPGIRALTEED